VQIGSLSKGKLMIKLGLESSEFGGIACLKVAAS
jgi:hypothetical protein